VLFARFSSTLARAICLLLIALSCSQFSRGALDPGYSIQLIQTEQGLPQNNINSIIQGRDGYLWLATLGGLARYDGVRFKIFNSANTPALQNSRITALFEDGNGVVWIGHETGDLTRMLGGKFEAVNLRGSPYREPVQAITMDGQGNLLLFYPSALLRTVRTGALIETDVSSEQQRGIASMVRDNSGTIWIARGGALARIVNGKSEPLEVDRFAADRLVLGIAAARDGGVWIATPNKIRKRMRDQWVEQINALPWRQTVIPTMMEMHDGVLAVATMDQGIWLLRPGSSAFRADRNDGLPPDWVRSMWEDSEGNLWAGFGGGGMAALRPARARLIKSVDRWKGRPVLTIASTGNGAVWAGTEGAGAYYLGYDALGPSFHDLAPMTNATVFSVAADDRDRLWMSTADGIFALDRERFQTPQRLEDFSSPARVLFQSPSHGAMLIGTHSGMVRYQNGNAELLLTNLVSPDVRCIVEQTNGVIWFGMFGGGLGYLENGKATQFRKASGLTSDFVQCLYIDPADGALWIGTAESGLNRYKDGKFASVTTAHGLRDNVISHIADDGLGNLWISSHSGIMRVARADLNRCADGAIPSLRCMSLAETDGLPAAQSYGGLQPTGCRTPDGLLWFATLRGVVAIDPANVRTNQLARPVIEELRVNEQPAKLGDKGIEIPPGRRRLDIDFTAITLAAPERALFKYRLEPVETDWSGPTTKRTVSYSYIPPGDYTFRLMACNSDGIWNERAASLAFTALPLFYQTLWFRILTVLVAIAFVGLAALLVTRARYRRQIEVAERQRGIERERTRIAQDIHDDLGSSLTRIILLSQSARGDLDSPDLAGKDLDRIYDTARNLTRSLDEIVWAVNPRHDTLDSLATYLGKFAQDFLGAANIRCRLDLPVSVPAWPLTAETRHNVFLAFKEALNNAVKHAQATEVRVSLTLQQSAFTLIVEDNGHGFSVPAAPAQTTDTEDGLQNMRKRLNEVGGRCEIYSQPKKGTRISFSVPVSAHAT
jgi:signal transduction histidine kinase/ligand-binding sensor domain-containing protein